MKTPTESDVKTTLLYTQVLGPRSGEFASRPDAFVLSITGHWGKSVPLNVRECASTHPPVLTKHTLSLSASCCPKGAQYSLFFGISLAHTDLAPPLNAICCLLLMGIVGAQPTFTAEPTCHCLKTNKQFEALSPCGNEMQTYRKSVNDDNNDVPGNALPIVGPSEPNSLSSSHASTCFRVWYSKRIHCIAQIAAYERDMSTTRQEAWLPKLPQLASCSVCGTY
jgi:hypothetical protein